MEKISEIIRRAIQDSGKSLRQLAAETGIDHTQLGRFVRQERTISQATIDQLGEYFGLELKAVKHRPNKPQT